MKEWLCYVTKPGTVTAEDVSDFISNWTKCEQVGGVDHLVKLNVRENLNVLQWMIIVSNERQLQ